MNKSQPQIPMRNLFFLSGIIIILSSCNRDQLRYSQIPNGIEYANSPTPQNILLDEDQPIISLVDANEMDPSIREEIKDETAFQTASANDDQSLLTFPKLKKNVLESFYSSYHAIKKNSKSFSVRKSKTEDEPEEGLNMLALLSFALSLVYIAAVVGSFFVFALSYITFLIAVAAVVIGFMALSQIKKRGGTGKGFAWAGIIIPAAIVVLGLILLLILVILIIANGGISIGG